LQSATAGDSQVTLSWSPPAQSKSWAVYGYWIYEGTSSGGESSSPVNTSPVQGTSCTVTGLANGTTYYFVVTAEFRSQILHQIGQGPASNEASAKPQSPLAAPTGLTATPGDSEVTLSWSPPASTGATVDGYWIYEGTSSGGESSSPLNTSLYQGTSYTVTGLANGTTYYFVVTAVWSAFGVSLGQGPPSDEASATPQSPLGPPTGLTATPGDSRVTLSWTPPAAGGGPPVVGYDIYDGTSSGGESGSPVNTSPVQDASYTVTGLSDGTTYYFTVAAVDSAGHPGPSSGEASATPVTATPQSPPGPPTGLTATAGDSRVTLSWTPPAAGGGPPVVGYDIHRGTRPGGESGNTSLVQGTRYTVTGLANGTTYYFTVAAVDSAGQRGPSSGEASATPRGPSPPSGWVIGHALPPPSASVFALPKVLESLALGALLIVLVGFPAELFNATYEENEARIRRALSGITHRKARETRSIARPWAVFIFFAVAAAFTALVEPSFDFGWIGATVFAGFVVAIPLTMTAYAYPAEWYERRASKITGRFRVIALALVVAAVLTVMSRLVHFVPGYVYGLIAGFTAKRTLSKSQEARSVLAGAACVFGLSVVAWILWGKYDAVAQVSHASHSEVIIGAVLAQLTILGITSVVFGLMPFKFMDGYRLRTWNLAAWIGVYAAAASWFALVLIRNNPDVLQQHNLPVAFAEPFILFAVFGVLSILFWLYFRLRPSPENAAEDGSAPRATPPAGQAVTSPGLARPGV
jgi:hypothetical protein